MQGLFDLRTPVDLMAKLEWEFGLLKATPLSSYHAYNFFVTAWHLLEWRYPDTRSESQKKYRESVHDGEVLLQVCEHLAVGAKHFEPSASKHKSVQETETGGVWAKDTWAPATWAEGCWAEWLLVRLDGEAAKELGAEIQLEVLAEKVVAYWRAELRKD